MAHVTEHLTVALPIEDVYRYVADFANIAEWDPSIRSSTRIDSGALGVGSAFEVVIGLAGRDLTFVYRVDAWEEPHHAVLSTSTTLFRGRDEITLAVAEGGGTVITWDADFSVRGPGRLLDPIVAVGFKGLAKSAMSGLQRELARQAASVR